MPRKYKRPQKKPYFTRKNKKKGIKKTRRNQKTKRQHGGCFTDLRIFWGNLWNNNPADKDGNRYLRD